MTQNAGQNTFSVLWLQHWFTFLYTVVVSLVKSLHGAALLQPFNLFDPICTMTDRAPKHNNLLSIKSTLFAL